jgi:hypothetical protein
MPRRHEKATTGGNAHKRRGFLAPQPPSIKSISQAIGLLTETGKTGATFAQKQITI